MIIKEQKGTVLVEFAIVLIILVLLGVGVGEFGLLVYNKQVVANASREGARAGIVSGVAFTNSDGIKTIVKNYCLERLIDFHDTTLEDSDIELTPGTDAERNAASFGSDFSVKVTYNYGFLVPSLFNMGPTISITGKTTMKKEETI